LVTRGVVWSLVLATVMGALTAGPAPITAAQPSDGFCQAGTTPPGQVVAATLFPDLLISSVQNALLPESVTEDHQILMGGVGSDLWHGPDDPPDVLWMVADRGPRG